MDGWAAGKFKMTSFLFFSIKGEDDRHYGPPPKLRREIPSISIRTGLTGPGGRRRGRSETLDI